jgi:hypothetical protein
MKGQLAHAQKPARKKLCLIPKQPKYLRTKQKQTSRAQRSRIVDEGSGPQ